MDKKKQQITADCIVWLSCFKLITWLPWDKVRSDTHSFFKVWMLPVQLSYLWQSGVTAGFPGILQHKTIHFNHISQRNNLLLTWHSIIKMTYLSSQNTHSVIKGQTSQNVFLNDVPIYVWQVIGDHNWITSFSTESSHNNSWHLKLPFLISAWERQRQ